MCLVSNIEALNLQFPMVTFLRDNNDMSNLLGSCKAFDNRLKDRNKMGKQWAPAIKIFPKIRINSLYPIFQNM